MMGNPSTVSQARVCVSDPCWEAKVCLASTAVSYSVESTGNLASGLYNSFNCATRALASFRR